MEVAVSIEEVVMTNDAGLDVDGVVAVCSRCGHETKSYGTSGRSRRRCLAIMREECPENEHNFYFDDGAEDREKELSF